MKSSKTAKRRIRTIPIAELTFDSRVNRKVNRASVSKLVKTWKPEQVGVIKVHQRNDGSFVILAGQHRVSAMRELGIHKCDCEVLTGLSTKEEAVIARDDHDRRDRRPLETFLIDETIGEPDAIAVRRACKNNDLKITGGGGDSYELHAIYAAREVAKWGAKQRYGNVEAKGTKYSHEDPGFAAIDDVLHIAVEAWNGSTDGLRSAMLRGLYLFMKNWYGYIDNPTLIKALASVDSVVDIQAESNRREVIEGKNRFQIIARIVESLYQKHARGSSRLPVPNYE